MQLRSLALLATLALCACQKNYTAYALTSTGSIIKFDTAKPGTIEDTQSVSGLDSGVSLVQIGYRPADSVLYGVTSDNELVTLDPSSGVAAVVSGTAFSSKTLSGATISFDPVHDELRLLSTEYNLRVGADGALDASGTKVAFDSGDDNDGKTPQLAAIGYTNPVDGASSTTLYALDVTTKNLVRVGNAGSSSVSSVDDGVLHTIGSLGVSFTVNAGLSLRKDSDTAYAVLQRSGSGAALYTVDLDTGEAAEVGSIGDGDQTLIALALVPES